MHKTLHTKQYLNQLKSSNLLQPVPSSPEPITCNGVEMIRETVKADQDEDAADCVYDLYYINDPEFDFATMDNILAIEAYR